jgi:hypothetical protein
MMLFPPNQNESVTGCDSQLLSSVENHRRDVNRLIRDCMKTHVAISAFVPTTTDGRLEEQTACLTRWAVYFSDEPHGCEPYFAPYA